MSKIPNSKSQITNSQTNFRETVSCLPSLSLFSTSFLIFPLGLCFPAGDVLKAVMENWMVSFSAPLLLFSQSLFSAFLLITNDQ